LKKKAGSRIDFKKEVENSIKRVHKSPEIRRLKIRKIIRIIVRKISEKYDQKNTGQKP
jgi:hypothetical protein